MSNTNIQPIQAAHLERYAEIYAKAFSGEPWNDPWRVEDAAIHISEIMESRHSYGLEYVVNGEVAGLSSARLCCSTTAEPLRSTTSPFTPIIKDRESPQSCWSGFWRI